MKNGTDIKIKRLIFLLVFVLIVIIIAIIWCFFLNDNNDISETNIVNETDNEITENLNRISNEVVNNTNIENSKTEENKEDNKEQTALKKTKDIATYFLVKQCMETYYHAGTADKALNIIDEEAKGSVTSSTLKWFEEAESSAFCIDEIYQQSLGNSKKIYLVNHRLETEPSIIKQSSILIKIDEKNETFSVYPYEYLKLHNYLNAKEDDVIAMDNAKDIEKKENNTYETTDSVINSESCMKELFARYKFDLLLDVEHLYNTLDTEYRDMRFRSLVELKQYITDNKTDLYLDTLSKYKITKYDQYIEYMGISNRENHYIFYATSLMEYTLRLDNYTIITSKDIYNGVLPTVQARYCIDRIMEAINDKNYRFVYEKLNPIQKNNYYSNINELENFIENNFYKKTSYEIDEDYLIISSDVYQYNIKITDATKSTFSYRNLIMTVNLKENEDFVISIQMQQD